MTKAFSFRVIGTDGRARSGEMRTAHGLVRTPAFVPVGTSGAVKRDYAPRPPGNRR